MSNKLVKSKSKRDKELEYYKKHCSLLEKENTDLKARNTELEMHISFASEKDDTSLSNLRELIKKTYMVKNMYEKLYKEVSEDKKLLEANLAEISSIKPLYMSRVDKALKPFDRFMN